METLCNPEQAKIRSIHNQTFWKKNFFIRIIGNIQQNNHKYAIAGVTKIRHEEWYHVFTSATGTLISHASEHVRFYHKYVPFWRQLLIRKYIRYLCMLCNLIIHISVQRSSSYSAALFVKGRFTKLCKQNFVTHAGNHFEACFKFLLSELAFIFWIYFPNLITKTVNYR